MEQAVAESLDEIRVARSALRHGCRVLELDDARIRIRWIHQAFCDTPGAKPTSSGHPIGGRFDPTKEFQIELRSGKSPEDLRRSAYHELRHLYQYRRYGLPDSEADVERRERDARQWADVMLSTERLGA
jgi:hypothetical protein